MIKVKWLISPDRTVWVVECSLGVPVEGAGVGEEVSRSHWTAGCNASCTQQQCCCTEHGSVLVLVAGPHLLGDLGLQSVGNVEIEWWCSEGQPVMHLQTSRKNINIRETNKTQKVF